MSNERFGWTLLRQALLQKKAKSLLIILAVAMGASVVAALLNLQLDLRSRMNLELRDYGPNVLIEPDSVAGQTKLRHEVAESLQKTSLTGRLIAFSPEVFVPATVANSPVLLVGANLPSLAKLYPNWVWSSQPQEDSMDAVFVGIRAARRLQVEPGAPLIIQANRTAKELKVAGFLEGGEAEDDQLFISLPLAQSLVEDDGYHVLILSVLGDWRTVEGELSRFVANYPGVRYQIIRKIARAESLILDRMSNLMGLIISLIFIILFFCIHTTVSAILISRQSEIALFRVLGARRKQIMTRLSAELVTLSVAGGFFGFCVGMLMAQILGKVLFQTWVMPRISIFVVTIVFSMIMVVTSSIIPILRAVNRQAALVLKEA